jgi:hypothetical protein
MHYTIAMAAVWMTIFETRPGNADDTTTLHPTLCPPRRHACPRESQRRAGDKALCFHN